MRKLLIVLLISSLILCGCAKISEEQASTVTSSETIRTYDTTSDPFESDVDTTSISDTKAPDTSGTDSYTIDQNAPPHFYTQTDAMLRIDFTLPGAKVFFEKIKQLSPDEVFDYLDSSAHTDLYKDSQSHCTANGVSTIDAVDVFRKALTSIKFINIADESVCSDIFCVYFPSLKSIQLVYDIDNTIYRFDYMLEINSLYPDDRVPDYTNLAIEDVTFDLYVREDNEKYLNGSFLADGMFVRVTVVDRDLKRNFCFEDFYFDYVLQEFK